jgi:GAF domain-containing protein
VSDGIEERRWRAYLPAAQIAIGVGGLLGAIFHAFPIHPALKREDWPVLDAVDIGWLGLIAVAVLLPGISKLTLGGVSVELREEARESAQELESTIQEYANLVQNWSASAMLYIDMLANATGDDERATLLAHYLRDRMGEAKNYLSEDPDDDVRIALWMYDPGTQRLEFFFSNEGAPTKQSYAVGEGMLGEAFMERRAFNEADVRNVPSYLDTRNGVDPPYRAVLCIPIFVGEEPIGMLTADKRNAVLFGTAADDIARGLAAQCALAIDQFRKAG